MAAGGGRKVVAGFWKWFLLQIREDTFLKLQIVELFFWHSKIGFLMNLDGPLDPDWLIFLHRGYILCLTLS